MPGPGPPVQRIHSLVTLHAAVRGPLARYCQYLALAELFDCELWTGDQRFYNAVRRTLGRVKWIGDYFKERHHRIQ